MNKILLVTGGSRGIGAATARLAAQAGYDVAINYLSNRDAAEQVVGEVVALGRRGLAIQADVSVEAEVVGLFETVDEELGRIDALANNAGIVQPAIRVDQVTAERLERLMRANVLSAFLCAREAVRRMSTRHGGRGGAIVNVSSAASRLGGANEYVDYAASKGAVDTLTIGLSKEVAEEGIRVNALRPGLIRTDIHASGGNPDRVDRLAPLVPLKRPGEPEEVAEAIVWLMSDAASYMTGTIIDISGGR